MTSALTTTQPTAITTASDDPFGKLVALTLSTVAESSARVYKQTFGLWLAWCTAQDADPLVLSPSNVLDFLKSADTTKATRQRQLSALRKLAGMLFVLTGRDDAQRINEALKMIKVPAASKVATERERTGKALDFRQVIKVLDTWNNPAEPRELRNRALIAVLALSGIRRSEAATLRWRDIDFDNGVITVVHGKGDKRREAPLAGDLALEALRGWHMAQPTDYQYVFTSVQRWGVVGADAPITGTDVYRIVEETEQRTGIEFNPHDLRRTFITEALDRGASLATVQAAAGHARGETTLRYAKTVDARKARQELKLRYS